MDRPLAHYLIDLDVVQFRASNKNKGDSLSCLFEPRRLLTDPDVRHHIGAALSEIVCNHCLANALLGMATSGIAWAAITAERTQRPLLYVRKSLDFDESNRYIEGIFPEDRQVILVDDLLFAGENKRRAIEIAADNGLGVTDVVVIIDRQLERKKDGLPLTTRYNIGFHSLITMDEIVQFMVNENAISEKELADLRTDYRRFDRWRMPGFAQ